MKKNETGATLYVPDHTKETPFSVANAEWFPGGSWTEFEDSFIQVLTGAEPAKKYFNSIEIQQQITC